MPGSGNGLGPVRNIELTINTGRVGFDGAWGYNQMHGNLLVCLAVRQEMENLQLALG